VREGLRGRALRLLARREHTRTELKARLASEADDPDELDALLDEMERLGYLSESRYVESVLNARRARFGSLRLLHDLRSKGVSEAGLSHAKAVLAAGELEAARTVWRKKFGRLPGSAAERARQARFLASRGFSAETVHRVLRPEDE
jgi:regulatory protein